MYRQCSTLEFWIYPAQIAACYRLLWLEILVLSSRLSVTTFFQILGYLHVTIYAERRCSFESVSFNSTRTTQCTVVPWYLDAPFVVQFPAGKRDFFPLHDAQIDPGAHQASYTLGARAVSLGVKRKECEADHSLASSAEDKNGESMQLLSYMS
jgi:hypothetical protein